MARDFKTIFCELYKPLSSVQKYHIFSMSKSKLGMVTCKAHADDEGVSEDVRRKFDGVKTASSKVKLMFDQFLVSFSLPKPNAEKLDQMYKKVRPFVPTEYQDDDLYAKPTAKTVALSKETKRARLKHRTEMAMEAKRIQDQRDELSFVQQLEGAMEEVAETQSQVKSVPQKKRAKKSTDS
ncbi:Hypothetical protein PHPALM_3366 [Phytophthora palmivora]|uniref:Uncharacterized protein n=1 Tax=Phytophthora palmivora TaxID=4796 RepID=A0A2P4YMK9_9STRA|nr:Hypothetical protein PHPALM_3366 [Phytophthora palmivora]